MIYFQRVKSAYITCFHMYPTMQVKMIYYLKGSSHFLLNPSRRCLTCEAKCFFGIILVILPFSVLVESGYMGYEILLTVIFHIGLCHKFRYQPSAKGLSRQWVEFQKVRAGQILTTKINICVNRRYLYFFPDRKSTKAWTNSYALERNSIQKIVEFVMTECWKRKHRTKTV